MTVEERLLTLENAHAKRRWSIIELNVVLMINFAATAAIGFYLFNQWMDKDVDPRGEAEIRTQKLVVVDAAGRIAAEIDSENGFRLSGSDVTIDGGSLSIRGGDFVLDSSSGQHVVSIGVTEGSQGGIIDVYNSGGKRVVTVQAGKDNAGLIGLKDASGEPKQTLPSKGLFGN